MPNPQAQAIGKALQQIASAGKDQQHFSLVVDKNNQLAFRPLSFKEKLGRRFGLGPASLSALFHHINSYQEDLDDLAHQMKQQGQDQALEVMQQELNRLYALRNKIPKAPDLFAKVNADWMKALPNEAKQLRMNEFIIPGTHDSAAYQIQLNKTPKGKWRKVAKGIRLGKIFGVKSVVESFTITQNYDLGKQLELGARYLDLRVSYDPKKQQYFLSHSFACMPLDQALSQIKTFMDAHPKEVLLLDINTDYEHKDNFGQAQTDELMTRLNHYLGHLAHRRPEPDKSASVVDVGKKTYQELVDSNERVVMGFASGVPKPSEGLDGSIKQIRWTSGLSARGWVNESKVDDALEGISSKLEHGAREEQQGRLLAVGATTTPDGKSIGKYVAAKYFPPIKIFKRFRNQKSTVQNSRDIQAQLPGILTEQDKREYHGVIYCDAPDHSAIFNQMIQINRARISKPVVEVSTEFVADEAAQPAALPPGLSRIPGFSKARQNAQLSTEKRPDAEATKTAIKPKRK